MVYRAKVYVPGGTQDAKERWQMNASGKMEWGDGTNDPDVDLYRSQANVLYTSDSFTVGGANFYANGSSTLGNDATDTATVRGLVTLSDSSATYPLRFGADVDLYRIAANNLYTPDTFSVGGQFYVSNGTYPPATIERTSSATNSYVGTMICNHKSTADAVDGFGSMLYFTMQDTGMASPSALAQIAALRAGADNTGELWLGARGSGTDCWGVSINQDRTKIYRGVAYSSTVVTGTTYTVLATDQTIVFTGTADCVVTMPDSVGLGRRLRFKNISSNGSKLTLTMNSGDTIDGSTFNPVLYRDQGIELEDYADEKWIQW
jgi:hypothetical protein